MEQITEEERAALETFQGRIGDLLEKMDDYDKHDLSLLRWIRASELDVTMAEERIRSALKWREEKQVDTILTGWEAPPLVKTSFPLKISGQSVDGCPVCVVDGGHWDVVEVMAQGHSEDYVNYWIQIVEQGVQFMKKKSKEGISQITQFILIIDLEGLEMKQIISREHIELQMRVMKLVEENYPEILKSAYVVNAPLVFETVYAVVKMILTGRTLAKVSIFGSNRFEWRTALLKEIPVDQLPAQLGGTNTSCPNYTVSMGHEFPAQGKRLPNVRFKTILVPAATHTDIDFTVDAVNTQINWNFKSEWYDVGFKLLYEDSEEIFKCDRVDSHLDTMKGTYVATKTGKYTLRFDNSYSRFRSKTIQYAYDLVPLSSTE